MLYLISLGLSDENDLSLKGLEAGKKCEKLYLEKYTNILNTTPEKLEKLFGKKVEEVERKNLEEDSGRLVEEARKKDIGILVSGDALAATTHLSLVAECRKSGVECRIIHSSSILTGVGECGLSLYKFGETITIPFWEENYKPAGFYETILKNKKAGLHTLILLDTKKGGMSVKEALEILEGIDKEGLLKDKLLALSGVGSEDQRILFGTVEEIKGKEWGKPAVLIVPGKLNEFEREFLEKGN